MTWKWALFIVLAIVAAELVVWVSLKAINGIAYEFEILINAMRDR